MKKINKKIIVSSYVLVILMSVLIYSSTSMPIENSEKMGIIFDCDGVLVDTEYLKFLAWQHALQQDKISFTLEEYIPLVGHSGEYILRKIAEQKNVTLGGNIYSLRNAHYLVLQKQGVPPLTGAIAFIHELVSKKRALNIVLGLASSAPRAEIMTNLQQIGLADAFDIIVSGKDDLFDYHDPEGTNKPKPYIYQKTAQLLGLSPARCMVFEDTNAGIVAASSAGMIAIAVPNIYTQQHDFSLATQIIDSFSGLSLTDLREKK